jgi:hypothetical protein
MEAHDMRLRFLGKDSTPTNSPTLYATDHGAYVVQGWVVSDPAILAACPMPDDETLVEVPPGLLKFLALDGLEGAARNLVPPIVQVLESGNYVMQGKRVTDDEALGQTRGFGSDEHPAARDLHSYRQASGRCAAGRRLTRVGAHLGVRPRPVPDDLRARGRTRRDA